MQLEISPSHGPIASEAATDANRIGTCSSHVRQGLRGDLKGPNGIQWNTKGPNGTQHDPAEYNGIQRNPAGPNGIQSTPYWSF